MYSIAIDGPAGAGKSSIAKEVARRLGFIYVDTGALYRTVALYLLKKGIGCENLEEVRRALSQITVNMAHMPDGQHVFLCGEDVTDLIRTPEVSMMASKSSAIQDVRRFLFTLQTRMADRYNVIMDGRDIGTVVLPNAQAKIFLTASPEVRARRRCLEFEGKGEGAEYSRVLEEIRQRDYQDSHRETAPLRPAEDAVILDTSDLSFGQVVEEFIRIVSEKLPGVSPVR